MPLTTIDVSDIHLRDIRFEVTRADGRLVDFSDLVTSFRWSDHVATAAVEVGLSLSGNVPDILKVGGEGSSCRITAPLVDLDSGQLVRRELWRGTFEEVVDERSDAKIDRQITAYDLLHFFATAEEDFVFSNLTLSQIVVSVCKQFQVSRGTIPATTRSLGQIISRGDAVWDVFQKAIQRHYDLTGEAWYVVAERGSVFLRKQGDQTRYWVFEDYWSTSKVRRTRTVREVINRIKIYGQFEGEATKPPIESVQEDTNSQRLYGLRQRIEYSSKEDEKRVIDTAKTRIKRGAAPEEELEVTGWLVPNLRAGEMVRFRDSNMNLDRLYYAESVESEWSSERAESIALLKREPIDPDILLDEITVA